VSALRLGERPKPLSNLTSSQFSFTPLTFSSTISPNSPLVITSQLSHDSISVDQCFGNSPPPVHISLSFPFFPSFFLTLPSFLSPRHFLP